MRRGFRTFVIIASILTFVDLLSSQDLKIGGYIKADDRVRLKDRAISWEEYRLSLTGEVKFDNVKFFSEIWFRNFGLNNVKYLLDLSNKNNVEPVNIDIREAYVDVKGFVFEDLDLRIGRQRIAWGTADKLNPTDNLNPDDLEDIWDFGRHLGSNAIKLSYYLGDFTLVGVFIPMFTPAVLPQGDWVDAFVDEFLSRFQLQGKDILEKVVVKNPERTVKDGSKFGFKISRKDILGLDVSLSYIGGRDDIPIPEKVFYTAIRMDSVRIDSVILSFPNMRVLGFDFAGDFEGVGIWGEVGIFYPDKIDVERVGKLGQVELRDTLNILEKKNYTRFVLGVDYTLKNGLYMNLQYLHGFLHERGRGNLRNYLVFNLEKKYLDDKIKLNFLSGGVEFKRIKDVRNNYALIYNPQINYKPTDNLEFVVGVRIIDGKGGATFGRLKDRDEVYLSVKYSF